MFEDMQMDERKTVILQAIIKNYLETGEPVGSRTISKDSTLNLSSATIRNEMADLEEMGYIIQPHTSAGRIPSDKGYRFYVDTLMEAQERELSEMKEMFSARQDKLEDMLKGVVKLLARDTQYATLITSPSAHRSKLKFIQLSKVDASHILGVVVIEGNIIRNRMIEVNDDLDEKTMLELNMLLNTQLNGIPIEEISLSMVARIKQQAGIHSEVISGVVDEVIQALAEEKDLEVYTSGANNIFKYPELADNENASRLITAFEEKEKLGSLLCESEPDSQETGIQVLIGNENSVEGMKDCSVVTTTYDLGDGMKGTIGIVGPKRMDYDKVVGTLKSIKQNLDELYHKGN